MSGNAFTSILWSTDVICLLKYNQINLEIRKNETMYLSFYALLTTLNARRLLPNGIRGIY